MSSKPTLAMAGGGKGGSRRYAPKRNSQKTFDENVWESQTVKKNTNRNIVERNSRSEICCNKCNLVFKGDNKETKLRQHQVTCLKLDTQDSFLKHIPSKDYDKTDKTELTPSQPSRNLPHQKNTKSLYAEVAATGTPLRETLTRKENNPLGGNNVKGATSVNIIETQQKKTSNKRDGNEIIQNNEHRVAPQEVQNVHIQNIHIPTPRDRVNAAYEVIVKWKRNLFDLPKGNNGKKFIDEITNQINTWCNTKDEKPLKMIMIMPSLLLQKASKKSKGKENKLLLERRLKLWEEEKYDELVAEGQSIQNRLQSGKRKIGESELVMQFRNHMTNGNVNAALRLLSSSNSSGILPISEETIKQLHEKHPIGEPLHQEMLLHGPVKFTHPVIFDEIDIALVQKVALRTKGAAGPSNFDANDWRNMIASRRYGNSNVDLCAAIARMARLVASETIQGDVLSALMACRLIPLDKNPGLRPIGIGEVLRRIIGKMVVWVLRPDLQEAAGDLQMCVGQEGGCEAGVHAMHAIFNEDETQGIIQVDANNAFNTINRQVFMHNINIICPEIATFVANCYQVPARLFVVGGIEIKSLEGTTQGAPSSMPVYAVGIIPLMLEAAEPTDNRIEKARQSAFADDLAAAGTMSELKKWWDIVVEYGPYIGYYAKAEKSWLIVKPEHEEEAKRVFRNSGLKITTEGRRHLGAVVGSENFKAEYVNDMIDTWVGELKTLGEIAKIEPHLAYTAYTFGFQHKYTYFLRTLPDIEPLIQRLDGSIDEFIKILLNGYNFSELERLWFSLPPKMGGLGITIPSKLCDIYYNNSIAMTATLVHRIVNQYRNTENMENNSRSVKAEIVREKQRRNEEKFELVRSQLDGQRQKILECTTEKGASSWLNTLPLKSHNFYLNKQLFWDSVYLRFGIQLPRLPVTCVCGSKFDVQHALSCKIGGFVGIRHNQVRDFTAEILDEVCNDVAIEPLLTPLSGEQFNLRSTITEEHARVDVSARDVWVRGSRAFFDIMVFNPLARSYSNSTLKASHKSNENLKKRKYNDRILQVEHGSFTPLVFTNFGGVGVEGSNFYNKIAEKIAEKRDIASSLMKSWIRTKLSFCLLRTTNLCIRGSRGKKFEAEPLKDTNIQLATVDSQINSGV